MRVHRAPKTKPELAHGTTHVGIVVRRRSNPTSRGRPSSWDDDVWFHDEQMHFTDLLTRQGQREGWHLIEGPRYDDAFDYSYVLQVRWTFPEDVGVELWPAGPTEADALDDESLWNEPYLPEDYDKILKRISGDVLGDPAAPRVEIAQADVDEINQHRRRLGMAPINLADGWTTEELRKQAAHIRSAGRMNNPLQHLKRSLMP